MRQFKYEQLAHKLMRQIEDNKWRCNEKLPSIRDLASIYSVSKISVQKALHTLEARGIVFVKTKSGYYVSAVKPQQQISQGLTQIDKPKLVDVPEIFYEIMERTAAFDIAPINLDITKPPNHLLLLNRHISRALRKNPQNNALYYCEPTGYLPLRHQISEHYRRRDLHISEQEICITSGCQNSLFLALTATCEPGDIVAIESPAFYGVLQLLQQLKLKVLELPTSYTIGLTADSLEEATKKWDIKACVLTANFATPTGALIPTKEKRKIAALATEKNIIIIEDDIYGDLGFHSKVESLKNYDTQGNFILCSSFSKSLSRDLRLGWIVAGKHLNKIVHMKLVYQLSTSQAIQYGLSSFLAEGHFERHLHQYRKVLLKQRDQLTDAIADNWKISTTFTVPDGGLAIWVQLPTEIDTFLLYKDAIAQGIIITPGRLFSSVKKFSNCLRLSFAHPTKGHRLQALIKLGELCEKVIQKGRIKEG
ncbi:MULTISPECIES: aminotransferase-like domain-containing protein [unclassified Colwellia]|jgi:DNA-binding transcriptional MocR family regulator|uniref:aminotransferase-like domain-containing protein n=1 Tax=unclassified Colwellia TaxID=196834 RepID=UPI0021756481|nr:MULTISPECIES: PLP-dependent aminotransferase family protein [unclassified Colwellia]